MKMIWSVGFSFLAGASLTLGAALPVLGAPPVQYEFVTLQMDSEVKGQLTQEKPYPEAPTMVPTTAYVPMGQGYHGEVESNGSVDTASPIVGSQAVIRANLFPNGDVDYYSFTANAGDRVYAATMTSFSAGISSDSQLTIFGSDGTTVLEFDDDNGSFAALSSSIAGTVIPATGTYYIRVNDFTAGAASQRGYELHFRLQSGAPTPEIEPNDTPSTANALPASGWVSGARGAAAATEQDWYSLTLNAGDTVFLSLDLDPERDGISWNGRLGMGLFGDATNQILVVDDTGTGDVPPNPNLASEAMFFTVKEAGTYFAFVDSASAAVGGPTATYHLSVSVNPATNEGVNCTTYTSTNVPQTIGPTAGLVSSTLTVPGNPRIADVDVSIQLNHALMQDVDAVLRSPAGTSVQLFSDIGAAATGGQQQMDATFDDEAGIPPIFNILRGVQIKPENNPTAATASTSGASRLSWFDGQNAGGTWTLDLYDDTGGANGGTLTAWSVRVCEVPPPPACPTGFTPTTVYSTDFESGAAGFTHGGTQDEWELGLPATMATTTANPIAAFDHCHSGTSCWKTDLDNSYNASGNQDLFSPDINLAGLSPPVVVSWAHRHQVESANFDHYFVDFEEVGGPAALRLFQWLDPAPISASAGTGNPQVNIGTGIGWGVQEVRADSLAGRNARLRFNLTSDATVNFGGVAIDDVSVTACRALEADLSITKTDGVSTATPGGSVSYTINASNAGPDPVTDATVADTFPAALTCTWTCVGAGGGTCTAAGIGNISDTVNLPVGGSAIYTASCTISAAATGTLSNTATVSSSITDPNTANNSATDSDTLIASADLAITKTNGTTSSTPGGTTTYTITASNAGPSNASGVTVADTFPASQTCTWTCVGAGGGTCPASGSGNINSSVNLPAGGSATYTASCAISASATGTMSNTATVAAPVSVTDPTPSNNSATDTDVLASTADLSITKTDGVTTVIPGGSITYMITASNAGPSNAPGATVADLFPASLTCTWTCVGAGGGTCTAAGSGNISDTVNLPAGGSTTYTASCNISDSASGTLINTASVAAPAGVTDPNPSNNSATDTDTILVLGALTVSPSSVDFGQIAVGDTSATLTVTLGNSGDVALSVTSLTAVSAPFSATGGSCGALPITIAGGDSCTLGYMFTPAATGVVNISVMADAGAAGAEAFTLIGEGVQGNLTITPASLDFGDVALGNPSAAQIVTLANTGSASLQVTALNAATAPFALSGGTCGATPITIAEGASCTLSYIFTPSATGAANQTLNVTADAPGSGSITLAGEGVQGVMSVLNAALDFGFQSPGSTTQQTLTIINSGMGPLEVMGISAAMQPFAEAGGTCAVLPFTLMGVETCTVIYSFAPTASGDFTQSLTITSDVGNTVVTLSGRGMLSATLVPIGDATNLLLLVLAILGSVVLLRQRV